MAKESSVFDSSQPLKQVHPETRRNRFSRLNTSGEKFEYTETRDDAPINLIERLKPSEIKGDDANYWNEKSISNSDFINIYQIVYYIYLFSKGAVLVFFPIGFLISLGSFFVHPFDDAVEVFVHLNTMGITYCLIPFGSGWGLTLLLFHYLAHKMVRKKYTLSRQTGMVTLYDNDEDVIYSHPFVEFDCRLFSSTNQYGHLSFGIALVHRYNDYSQHITIGEMIGSTHPDDHKRLWNVIQQYMDVSQPLPDLPILEAFRSKDPTTTAYDKEIGRDPNYWRSMSDKEFDQVVAQMAENQKHIPPLGKPINIYAQTPEEIHAI
ncbi:Conserved hypothetical protein [Vibrio nigripulchritudo SFn27]|uniref:Uncharacterized protein n=1 Tax=Vibrio nigripulchritudo TaxID=28173 RepID=U4K8J0_9VIBR|nr:hypothetical protein [Vibrio nigripulchritudo]CCN84751.1 Conserved hypothetical protein [Vibrio nigripulchritudo BLFn1]CCN87757.1 Conserved hypothetical protein [Vibrio nigripulchritudo SFn27]CCN95748.1 Conserved hypothetical protein [Vibrio nigripulchritudo ENn2]CCO38904.1 Conserved hypothetical protein [Vibrio nigripulchritudo SFn135]CCO51864.1 Conserved hypothetical protein [Vibrio nigripulchritudo Wn13]